MTHNTDIYPYLPSIAISWAFICCVSISPEHCCVHWIASPLTRSHGPIRFVLTSSAPNLISPCIQWPCWLCQVICNPCSVSISWALLYTSPEHCMMCIYLLSIAVCPSPEHCCVSISWALLRVHLLCACPCISWALLCISISWALLCIYLLSTVIYYLLAVCLHNEVNSIKIVHSILVYFPSKLKVQVFIAMGVALHALSL